MKIRIYSILVSLSFVFLSALSAVGAEKEFGMITDLTGTSVIQRDGKNIQAQFGFELRRGDSIQVHPQSNLIIVAYGSCFEWNFIDAQEVQEIIINLDGTVKTTPSNSFSKRKLPACYQPEGFSYDGRNVIGGYVLRGLSKEEMEKASQIENLKHAAKEGRITGGELLSLVIYEMEHDRLREAKLYVEMLLEKHPNAQVPSAIMKRLYQQ